MDSVNSSSNHNTGQSIQFGENAIGKKSHSFASVAMHGYVWVRDRNFRRIYWFHESTELLNPQMSHSLIWRCQCLRSQSKLHQSCAGMVCCEIPLFFDFVILPGEYVKMPMMKAWCLWVSVLALPVCELVWLHN